jgi:hypothetical protein
MRRDTSRGLLEDKEEGNAARYRKYGPVGPLMQSVQALQILQKVLRVGL